MVAATPNSLDAIARLRALAGRLLEHGDPDAGWFAAALAVYEEGDVSIDAALGLHHARWRTGAARRRRDGMLVEMAVRFYSAEPSDRQRARKVASKIRNFAAGARRWKPGTVEELAHYALTVCPAPSVRTVERALAGAPNSCAPGAPKRLHLPHEDVTAIS